MRKEELIASLIQEAHNEVSKHNCRFSVDAEAQLRELITAGVERMTVEELYNGSKIAEAQRTCAICARNSASGLDVRTDY